MQIFCLTGVVLALGCSDWVHGLAGVLCCEGCVEHVDVVGMGCGELVHRSVSALCCEDCDDLVHVRAGKPCCVGCVGGVGDE